MNSAKLCWLFLGILAVASAFVYLPLANQLGLYKDDWFLIYDAHTQGSQFFHTIYAIDRPARAYVMEITYDLCGDHILYYHLSAYLYRVFAAWALFWVLEMIWPQYKRSNFLISLLFLIYPGFLSQINPVDYQAQILSLCLAFSSIAFTIKSIKSNNRFHKTIWLGASTLTGVFYPALVDYFIGLEVLRLGFLIQLVLHENKAQLKETINKTLSLWLPFLISPTVFIFWRVFIFQSERRSTDLVVQISQLFISPLTGFWWLVNWMQDIFRVIFLAWAVPVSNLALNLRLRDLVMGAGVSA